MPEMKKFMPDGLTRPEKSLQLLVNNPAISLQFVISPEMALQ